METIADIQEHKIESDDEIEINPRTGQPYKQSKRIREQKRNWARKNPQASVPFIKNWIRNNRERWNAICRINQAKTRMELLYLRELFAEALI